MIESWFKQDLNSPVQVKTISGNVFSQDNQANLIGVEVLDNGSPAELTGTVSAYVIRQDGGTIEIDEGTLEGNRCSIILPATAYAVPGSLNIAIKLTDDETVTTLLDVVGTVYRTSTDAAVYPGELIPSINTLIEELEQTIDAMQDAADDIEEQKDTMIASIAAIAEMGTDTTLTQSGVAADAKVTGDKLNEVKSALQEIPIDVSVKETTKDGVDLDVSDSTGNVIARFSDGHFQTKEFDSRDVGALTPEASLTDIGKALIVKQVSGGKATAYEFGETGGESYVEVNETTKENVDIDFADLRGNVLLRLKDGHIQTKEFDSSTFIDDTAGDGDTNKVWSANKTYNEIEPFKRVRTRMEFGAHNGAEYYAPECTIPAYRIAGQQGWQWAWVAGIEFSADGTMYVLHDDTVDRTTDGTGYLNQMTDAEINALHITQTGPGYDLSDFDPSELIIPTFEQVLQQCIFYGMKMVLRLALFPNQYETAAQKEKWDKLVAMLNAYGVQPEDISCYVSTGNQVNVCRTLFGSNVEVSTFLGNAGTAQDYVDWFTSCSITGKKAAIISIENCDLTAAKLLHSYGIRVYTYKYNPTETDAINCASIGVDIFQNGKVSKITF